MERLTYWTGLVGLAIILCHLQTSMACSCIYKHPQTHFCESEFVALFTVEEFTKLNEFRDARYKVHVNETFKATPSAKAVLEGNPVWLRTSPQSATCGRVGLNVGDTWVISGFVNNNDLSTWSCELAMLWSSLKPHQRYNFRNLYQDGCACQITSGFGPSAGNKTCSMWGRPEERDCDQRHDACTPGSAGCSWTGCKDMA